MATTEAAKNASNFNKGPSQGQEMWSVPVFGCFHDFSVFIFTFLCPCYTMGRNAQYFGEDGALTGILYGLGVIGVGPVIRWRIRQEKNIRGSMLQDVALHMFCPCCALMQENKELYGYYGSHIGEKFPIVSDNIERQWKDIILAVQINGWIYCRKTLMPCIYTFVDIFHRDAFYKFYFDCWVVKIVEWNTFNEELFLKSNSMHLSL